EKERLEAMGLVTQIRKVIDVKDSFSKMNIERKKETDRVKEIEKEKAERLKKKKQEIEQVKKEFYSLFSKDKDPHKRGKELEAVVNKLFKVHDISVKESFALCGDAGEGIIEQIDGVIEIDGIIYLVEMKWWNKPLGRPEVSQLLSSLYSRADCRGIFISESGFSEPAITEVKNALRDKVVILCTLEELVCLLEKEKDLKEFLKCKVTCAVVDKNPFFVVRE
ncbi:MAG: restriction endonuclease, partial [Candidatus Wallbacteria bacterium]|nr:restriction endonuclease [Candidatus Wallbacteria bacterium]